MSSWSCHVCTYKNDGKDGESLHANKCALCMTRRKVFPKSNTSGAANTTSATNKSSSTSTSKSSSTSTTTTTATSTKKVTQLTLFGARVEEKTKKTQPPLTKPLRQQQIVLPPKKKAAESRKRKTPPPSSSYSTITTTTTSTFATAAASAAPSLSSTRPSRHNIQFSFQCKRNNYNTTTSKTNSILEQDIQNVLTNVFGLSKLRPLQQQSIMTTLQKQQNQLIVLATGGGKSLCYQLPACLLGGITIVISPLIALMQDQVLALQTKFHIPAACISSSQTNSENQQIMDRITRNAGKGKNNNSNNNNNNSNNAGGNNNNAACPVLLYITPESIQTERMRNVLKELAADDRLAMFAVDEAHCLSSWGHDFRPAYRKLSWLRTEFPKVLCMACTATATPQVISDIQSILHLQKAPLHKGSFDRPNIFYKVKYKDTFTTHMKTPLQDMVDFVKKRHNDAKENGEDHCSGIVYVHKRDDTQLIARALQNVGIRAEAYHAGLKDAQRNQVQHDWSNNTLQVAVATVAFGMGIDLAHVRYVIHWTLPKTLEGFYQESGRAGRDGLPSHSILYYSQEDARKFQWLIGQQVPTKKNSNEASAAANKRQQNQKLKALEEMVQYCTKPQCRRNALIRHFGGSPVDCQGTCDYCVDPQKVQRAIQSAAALADDGSNYYNKKNNFSKDSEWDGQWHGLHDDDNDDNNEDRIARDWGEEHGGDVVGGLRITGPASYIDGDDDDGIDYSNKAAKKKKRLPTASAVLAKYEVLEYREKNGKSNGFVRFRAKDQQQHIDFEDRKQVPTLQIPEHLCVKLPAKTTSTTNEKKAPSPTSADHAAAAKKLEEEIAALDAEREARMKALLAKVKASRK